MKCWIPILAVFLTIFLGKMWLPEAVLAHVFVNELHPSPSEGADWIELFYTGSEPVDMTGWSLWDAASQLNVTPDFDELLMSAGSYVVFEVGTRLNTGGDTVILKNQLGEIVDQVSYTNAMQNMSWARGPDGGDLWESQAPSRATANMTPAPSPTSQPTHSPPPTPSTSPSPIPTPSPSPTPSPTPVIFPPEIRFSEVQACPETGEEEWLELYNPSNENFTLTNWKVRDTAGNSRTINSSFPASTFTVLTWSGSLLNNDGDTVILERSDGQKMIEQALPACTKGETFIVINGTITTTTSSTKGSANMSSGQVISPVTSQVISSTATSSAKTSGTPSPTNTTVSTTPHPSNTPASQKSSIPFQLPYLATALQLERETSNSAEISISKEIQNPIHPRLLQLSASLFSLGMITASGTGLGLWQWYTGFRDRYLEATL